MRKKYFLGFLIILPLFFNSLFAQETSSFIPINIDDGINILIPYKKQYVPPKNSLEYTAITTINGKTIRVDRTPDGLVFEGYKGKIVLLEIYGYSCPHCQASIPGYNRIQAKYSNDVYVISIESYGLSTTKLKQYVKDYNMQYDTVSKNNSGNIFNFVTKLTGWTLGAGVPWLMIFKQDGSLANSPQLGDIDENYVESIINELL